MRLKLARLEPPTFFIGRSTADGVIDGIKIVGAQPLAPSKQLLMKNLSSTLIISAVYLLFVTLLMNGGLARDTFLGNYGLGYKAQILISLLQGMWTSMTGTGFGILIITLRFDRCQSFSFAGENKETSETKDLYAWLWVEVLSWVL